jgi:hypothetical protein
MAKKKIRKSKLAPAKSGRGPDPAQTILPVDSPEVGRLVAEANEAGGAGLQ